MIQRHREILEYVDSFVSKNGYAPSIREIGAHIGMGVNSTYLHIGKMEGKGWLGRTPHVARSIVVLPEGKRRLEEWRQV